MSNTLTAAAAGKPIKVMCIYGSPRKGGNTDTLMDAFAEGVEQAGATPHKVYLRELEISPCREIYACRKAGKCAIRDDMTALYDELATTHGIALGSPVMFYGVTAFAKAFIDRCQAFWCVRYVLEKPVNEARDITPKAVLITLGGSKGKKLFDGVRLTYKYFLDAIDAEDFGELTFRELDRINDAKKREGATDEARALGVALVKAIRAELEGKGG